MGRSGEHLHRLRLRLGFVHPLQDVTLYQCFSLWSVAFLIQVVPSFSVMSSRHLLLGRPLDVFPLLGCHSVQRLVHLLSFILAIWPAHFHFCFSVYSMISIIFVLFLISEHGILSCSFRSNIILSIALWAVLSLSFVYLETVFGSHRPLLARHIGPLLVFF